ncbi:MAG: restriction endonuclease subunit S [Halothece sp.]
MNAIIKQKINLKNVCDHNGIFVDGDWIESKNQNPNGEVRLIQLADIGIGCFLDRSSKFLTLEKAKELNCTFLKEGDILVARMPDPIGRACIFPKIDQICVTVVEVCIIRPDQNFVYNRWLMWILNSPLFQRQFTSYLSGTTRKRISRKNLETSHIEVPPLEEQKRIAEILDRADAIRQKRKRAIALTEELARSTFLEMFGDPVINPKGWEIKRLQLKTPMSSVTQSNQLQLTLTQLKQQLQEIYQDQLINLILFGSQARGDAEPDSDIDVLVVLAGAVNPIAEIKRNNSLITNLSLETDQLINCIYISEQDWHYLKTPLIQNIYKEGIPV